MKILILALFTLIASVACSLNAKKRIRGALGKEEKVQILRSKEDSSIVELRKSVWTSAVVLNAVLSNDCLRPYSITRQHCFFKGNQLSEPLKGFEFVDLGGSVISLSGENKNDGIILSRALLNLSSLNDFTNMNRHPVVLLLGAIYNSEEKTPEALQRILLAYAALSATFDEEKATDWWKLFLSRFIKDKSIISKLVMDLSTARHLLRKGLDKSGNKLASDNTNKFLSVDDKEMRDWINAALNMVVYAERDKGKIDIAKYLHSQKWIN